MEATDTRVYRVSGDVPVDDEVPMVTLNFKMIVLVYSILCTATKAERKTRELPIYLWYRFTHFAPYVLRLGVV